MNFWLMLWGVQAPRNEFYAVTDQNPYSMAIGMLEGEHCALSIAMPISRYSDELGESFVSELRAVVGDVRRAFGIRPTV